MTKHRVMSHITWAALAFALWSAIGVSLSEPRVIAICLIVMALRFHGEYFQ